MGHQSLFSVQVGDLESLRPVVEVSGEVDLASAPQLASALASVLAEDPLDVVLDLGETTFMDCSGVSVLLTTSRYLPEHSKIIIRNPQPLIRKIFGILDLAPFYGIDESFA
jgi:anti-sigma B factor antagonist